MVQQFIYCLLAPLLDLYPYMDYNMLIQILVKTLISIVLNFQKAAVKQLQDFSLEQGTGRPWLQKDQIRMMFGDGYSQAVISVFSQNYSPLQQDQYLLVTYAMWLTFTLACQRQHRRQEHGCLHVCLVLPFFLRMTRMLGNCLPSNIQIQLVWNVKITNILKRNKQIDNRDRLLSPFAGVSYQASVIYFVFAFQILRLLSKIELAGARTFWQRRLLNILYIKIEIDSSYYIHMQFYRPQSSNMYKHIPGYSIQLCDYGNLTNSDLGGS